MMMQTERQPVAVLSSEAINNLLFKLELSVLCDEGLLRSWIGWNAEDTMLDSCSCSVLVLTAHRVRHQVKHA